MEVDIKAVLAGTYIGRSRIKTVGEFDFKLHEVSAKLVWDFIGRGEIVQDSKSSEQSEKPDDLAEMASLVGHALLNRKPTDKEIVSFTENLGEGILGELLKSVINYNRPDDDEEDPLKKS